ncbi:MAG: hydrolase [Hyphomicrobiaceae bacterium]|nr:hydrolase [Hyphomicrobiaceae bacterium]
MRLRRQRSHLVIIDVQENLAPHVANAARVVAHCRRLITYARRLDIPVTLTEHYPKGLGVTVAPVREAAGPQAIRLAKIEFSCVLNAELRERFHSLRGNQGRDQLVVAGMEAHVCVGQTVLDLLDDGFRVSVVGDGVGSRSPEDRAIALARMAKSGADIVSQEMVAFEWLERAGTPEFRDLIPLIKAASEERDES